MNGWDVIQLQIPLRRVEKAGAKAYPLSTVFNNLVKFFFAKLNKEIASAATVKSKVGHLADDFTARVEALSLQQLENLGEALLDFEGREDLVQWLEMNMIR